MSNRADDGGGIAGHGGGTVTLTDSPVMSNTAPYGGGGIDMSGGAVLVLTSTIADNTAGAGGGMVVDGGITTLRNSAVVRNTASSGDGGGILIMNSGSLSLTNSTLSANSATASGGAIANGSGNTSGGSLAVSFSTISANSAHSGGGIAATAATPPPGMAPPIAAMTLNASILAGNTAPSGPDCAGAATSLGYNLIGDADGCSGVSAAGDLTGSGASPLDPRLGPLADNGGPTWTMAPQSGSPALDAVPIAKCSVSTDQRGQPRPDPLYNGACDSGAVEVPAAAPPATPTATPTSTPIATNTPTPTSAATSTPRLALVPTSAHVGDRVLVAGSGFGPNELLTLALNGEALAPTTIRTSGQGRFTATFTAPDSLLPGANALSAVGATSWRVALGTVLGRRSTQTYYLAGGVESSTEHAALDLLNTSAQRAQVGYTLYSQTGDTTRGTLTVGAHVARVVPIAGPTSLRGSFGLSPSAPIARSRRN
jgi:hypothetical protein